MEVMRQMGKTNTSKQRLDRIFRTMDKDEDGTIDYEEFHAWWKKQKKEDRAALALSQDNKLAIICEVDNPISGDEGDVVCECIRVGTRSPVPQLPSRVSLTLLSDPLSLLLPTCTSVRPSVDQPEQTGSSPVAKHVAQFYMAQRDRHLNILSDACCPR